MNTELDFDAGPHAICFTCSGVQRTTTPRLYQIQIDEQLTTCITIGEYRTCPQCHGAGQLPLQAPM